MDNFYRNAVCKVCCQKFLPCHSQKWNWNEDLEKWLFVGDTNLDVSYPNWSMGWEEANNPCPPGWRVPSKYELENLHNSGSTWGQLNGVNGRYYGSGGEKIFLPAVGLRNFNGTHSDNFVGGVSGSKGYYWTDDCYGSSTSAHAYYLLFSNINSQGTAYYGDRRFTLPVRCVLE